MCTGVSYRNGANHFFGRNLDLEIDYPVDVVISPHNVPFPMRHTDDINTHNAIIGMGLCQNNFPLYFEGMNDKGLGMAGLAFWTSCWYAPVAEGKTNVASFELIPYILGTCDTVAKAKKAFENLNITNEGFSAQMAPSPLHWIIADKDSCIVVEQTKVHGLQVYDNPYDVLTNEPAFPFHVNNLSFYCNVSNHIENFDSTRFAPDFPNFVKMGAGMGSAGLPGGLDSISRFQRVAFTRLNSICPDTKEATLSQFFHLLGSVYQTRGADQVKPGEYEITQYSVAIDSDTHTLYYTTYNNQSINAVHMNKENLESDKLISYPLLRDLQVNYQN